MNITGMSEQWVATRIKQKRDSKCIPWKNLKDLILAQPDMRKKVDVFALSICGLVGVTPVPAILAETFRSLNECRRAVAIPRQGDILEEKWMEILQNLQEEDVEWRTPWMLSDEILYRCEDFNWVPLLRIWGAIGYAPLLVLRQYRSRQFIPTIQGLAQCKFSYKCDGYKKKNRDVTNTWRQTRQMKRLAVGPSTAPEYIE
ncbi:hypothetical protein Goari_020717 [Gossypium aridum]|uniref:DUF7745 domain-containing protein n=1 Tax=Gossypium aridum TaxID=34290 RepID=A0A7J8YTT9_GOSAI|nr:hypothetical protein [Gossypium aridum]